MENIRENDVKVEEVIYKQPGSVEVFKVKLLKNGQFICMKKLFVEDIMEATDKTTEFLAMAQFQHPNITILRSACLGGQNREISYILIFMEFFAEGDLEKLIQNHMRSKRYLPEEKILNYLKQLVDAFCYLEDKGVAHRDIKPQNIFVTDGGERLKVGDFGNAAKKLTISKQTLAGTPMYLSPKLRAAFQNNSRGECHLVEHDIFKSDVYSLGLTFLYMSSMRSLKEAINSERYHQNLLEIIQSLSQDYKFLKTLLFKMLELEEIDRPNFKELSEMIMKRREMEVQPIVKPVLGNCLICNEGIYESNSYKVNNIFICFSCFQNHNSAINFSIQMYFIFRKVFHDNREIYFDYNDSNLCGYCKLKKHPNLSCLKNSEYLKKVKSQACYWECPKCPNHKIINNQHYDIFPYCESFHSFCVVCLNPTSGKNHKICVALFSSVLS